MKEVRENELLNVTVNEEKGNNENMDIVETKKEINFKETMQNITKQIEEVYWDDKEYRGFSIENSSVVSDEINTPKLLENYKKQIWEEVEVIDYTLSFNAKKRKSRDRISNQEVEEMINFTGMKDPTVKLKSASKILGIKQTDILKLLQVRLIDSKKVLLNENVCAIYKPVFSQDRKIVNVIMEIFLTTKGLKTLQSMFVITNKAE